MADVREYREALGRLTDEIGQLSQHWYIRVVDTLAATFEGRFADAEALAEEALRIGARTQSWQPSMYRDLQLWSLRMEQGRLVELAGALRAWKRENPGYLILDTLEVLLLAATGEAARARRALDAVAADGFAGLSPDEQWLWGLSMLTDAAALLDAAEHAAGLYERLAPHEGLVVMTPWEAARGSVGRFLGMLATLLERWEDAERHFTRALARDTAMGGRPAAAHDRHEHARMLLRSGRDPERARVLLAEAAAEFDALGMGPCATEARAALQT
jgi:tetratricopeptide (TPR) repeat protein